ncbi:MAG: response regulator, partial [Bacteroidetes bacterium]
DSYKPDLLLAEYELDDMDSVQLKQIVSEKFDLPIVLMSYAAKRKSIREQDPHIPIIHKPLRMEQLHETICMQLGLIESEGGASGTRHQQQLLAQEFPLRILVVEDNPINQKLAMRMLNKMGYEPEIAENGQEAVAKVQETAYDLIFMDVQMPVMDGLEATRIILQSHQHSRPPLIIAMTANAMQGDSDVCFEAGMKDYLSKPFRMSELRDLLIKYGKKLCAHEA